MPDQFDDLWTTLRQDAEIWVDTKAPSRFSRDLLNDTFDGLPAMRDFEDRVAGMSHEAVAQAYVNHVRRDAKTKVRSDMLRTGTSTVRDFFRAEVDTPSLFGVGGLCLKPVIYQLDEFGDILVPLRHLSIREAAIREQAAAKAEAKDLRAREANINLALHLLDEGDLDDGSLGENGIDFYKRFRAESGR